VLKPIESNATLPARIIRSAQEIFRPYFCLIGHNSRRALSRLALSGQLLSGAKRCWPLPAPPRPSAMRYVPAACHAIRIIRPDHSIEVEGLEFLGVVERRTHRIRQRGVPMENLKVQLVRPPVTVGLSDVHHRAFARALVGFGVHSTLRACSACCPLLYKDHCCLESEPAS